MRTDATQEKIRNLIENLGRLSTGPGTVYLVGGSSIVLEGLRASTIDVDLKLDPEPSGIFEAIASLKNELQLNIELAAPDQFIPEVPSWKERSPLIDKVGDVEFRHYDFYSQALAKLERGHDRDLRDVADLISHGMVEADRLKDYFDQIESHLIRYPSVDPTEFRRRVENATTE